MVIVMPKQYTMNFSLTFNRSSTPGPQVGLGLAYTLFCLAGTTGSLIALYIVALKRSKSYASADHLFEGSCATSLLVSLLVAPVHAYTVATTQAPSAALCRCIGFLYVFITIASPLTHVTIALNRFLVVVCNAKHFVKRPKVIATLVLFPWLFTLLCCVWPLFGVGGEYGYSRTINRCVLGRPTSPRYHAFLRTVAPVLSMPVMVACYTALYLKVYLAKRKIWVHGHTLPGRKPTEHVVVAAPARKQRQLEMHVTKVACISCVGFICVYLPTGVYGLAANSSSLHSSANTYISLLGWIGYALSPWLAICLDTTLKNHAIRHFLEVRHLDCCYSRQRDAELQTQASLSLRRTSTKSNTSLKATKPETISTQPEAITADKNAPARKDT